MDARNRLLALWWADHIVKKWHKKHDELFDTYPIQQYSATDGWKTGKDYWSVIDCSTQRTGEPCHAGKSCKCSAGQNTHTKRSMSMKDKGQVIEDLRIERRELEEKLEELGKFIFSKDFSKCGSNQMRLLHEERAKLMSYIDILTARINDLLGNPKG